MQKPTVPRLLCLAFFYCLLFHATLADSTWYSALQSCLQTCSISGPSPANWTTYASLDRLASCDQPLSLDFALHNPIDDPTINNLIFACTSAPIASGDVTLEGAGVSQEARLQTIVGSGSGNGTAASAAAQQAQKQLMSLMSQGRDGIYTRAYANGASVAVYAGSQIHNAGVSDFLQDFTKALKPGPQLKQVCGSGRNAKYILGAFVNSGSSTSP